MSSRQVTNNSHKKNPKETTLCTYPVHLLSTIPACFSLISGYPVSNFQFVDEFIYLFIRLFVCLLFPNEQTLCYHFKRPRRGGSGQEEERKKGRKEGTTLCLLLLRNETDDPFIYQEPASRHHVLQVLVYHQLPFGTAAATAAVVVDILVRH
jgi:hypothetical protein